MGKELAAIPIAAYFIDRRRRHKNKAEKLLDPRNLSDDFEDEEDFNQNDSIRGQSYAGDIRGSDPLSFESRSTKEKKKRPVVYRFGLRKKALAGGAIGLAGLVAGTSLASPPREQKERPRRYPYQR